MATKKTKAPVKRAVKGRARIEMTPALAKAIRTWSTLKRRDPTSPDAQIRYDGVEGLFVCYDEQIRRITSKAVVAVLRAIDAIAKGGA